MSTSSREQSRKNAILLASFRLYLLGHPYKKIKRIGATEDTLKKCTDFHDAMLANKNCANTAVALGIGYRVGHTMKKMYLQFTKGEEIDCHLKHYKQINRVPTIYSLLLSGISEHELLATGYSKDEIEQAKLVDNIVRADKLYSVLSKETQIPVGTLKKLRKTYNDYQEAMCLM